MSTRTVGFGDFSEEQLRVHRAGQALHRDGASPAGALDLLAAIVEDRTWERVADVHGRSFEGRFREFVEAKSPFGLGYDLDQLPKVLALRHPHESVPRVAERMDAMRDAVRALLVTETPPLRQAGRPGKGSATTFSSPGRGTAYVAARLKRDAPDLAERVASGQISPAAAAQQMGWRRPRIVVSSPERVAESLRRTMPPEDLARLAAILSEVP